MMQWALLFVGGLLGSSHCIGMCGGFALALAAGSKGWGANLQRQFAWCLGRVFTYAVGGAAAGYGGWRLASQFRPLVNVQAGLAILAGVLLIAQGFISSGIIRPWQWTKRHGSCLYGGPLASLLAAPGLKNAFLSGVANGFLPCGLVYAYLALAASSGGLAPGLLSMTAFGCGTMPVMILVGSGGSLLGSISRQHVVRVAALCVVLTGVISLTRGIGALPAAIGAERAETLRCPLCR